MKHHLKVISENYGVRYSGAGFGARPDLTDPELVSHPLSEGKKIVREYASFKEAFLEAHRLIGSGESQGDVDVIRITHHEPYQRHTGFFLSVFEPNESTPKETVTMTVTGVHTIEGMPHFTSVKHLSRQHPVNGWVIPESIEIEE